MVCLPSAFGNVWLFLKQMGGTLQYFVKEERAVIQQQQKLFTKINYIIHYYLVVWEVSITHKFYWAVVVWKMVKLLDLRYC